MFVMFMVDLNKSIKNVKDSRLIYINTKKLTNASVGSKAFTGIASKPTVKCPKGMVKTYKKLLASKGMPKKTVYK